MSERTPSNKIEKVASIKEREPELSSALSAAFEATSMRTTQTEQFSALIAFEGAIRDGDSVNRALAEATYPVAMKMETELGERFASNRVTAQIGVDFWDAMGPHEEGEEPTPAIERALDGFAPDGESWLAAKAEFTDAIERGVNVDIALGLALNTISEGAETHPEVARDRFYAGIDPNYAENEHFKGRKHGVRVDLGEKSFEIGVGPKVRAKRQRHLGNLAAKHGQNK